MKPNIPPVLIIFALLCFALVQNTQAVSPPPDGGYPAGNTAEGQNALFSLTAGTKNTANGYLALFANTTGQYNTAVGSQALYSNATGSNNTAVGLDALFYNTLGDSNSATGYLALLKNTVGSFNTANGDQALLSNTTGDSNTATGFKSLLSNTTGGENTAIGTAALVSNTTGDQNTANGFQALYSNREGGSNTAIGVQALMSNTFNGFNTAIGTQALRNNISNGNTATGYQALYGNRTGAGNTATGASALMGNTIGSDNTAIGTSALANNVSGAQNTAVGSFAGDNVTFADNVICIGNNVHGANVSISCFIGNIREVTTAHADAIPVVIDSHSQLGTISSSRRFKKEIRPMDKTSEAILALKPVSFQYKSDTKNTPQFGLIAEEVAKVNPDLVVRDRNGEIYTVRYEAVNAMLLNEFLKEHRRNEEQEATIARLQKQVEALTAGLQKVSAQLEVSKPAPQTVLNNH